MHQINFVVQLQCGQYNTWNYKLMKGRLSCTSTELNNINVEEIEFTNSHRKIHQQ